MKVMSWKLLTVQKSEFIVLTDSLLWDSWLAYENKFTPFCIQTLLQYQPNYGSQEQKMRGCTSFFTYNFVRGFWSLPIIFFCRPPLWPTAVFNPPPFPTHSVHHIHVRFQLSHSNTSQRYLQFSKRTWLDANNLRGTVHFKSQRSQSDLPRGEEERDICKNPQQMSGPSPHCPISPSLFLVSPFLPFPISSFIPSHGL